jgi:hypothetical protein
MNLSINNFFIENASTDDLWDLSAEILTELSRRDKVQYRIKATEESVQKKLLSL